ncbi:ATP-binding protein [Geobacter sp. AOG1]|uniref:ATP-binding protein n=1 Tax=Geobacter sp. AOG1 TaxID=1566346 RepID=UPI001CC75F80|nr:ATP-binding protein [Geobacter sp. AOG1]GFE58529.1 PAS domain-containing sensor histidine kinase [Geobacter sp. AOG1]
MKNSLEKRIILFSFIILFLTILAESGMGIAGSRRDYVNSLVLRCSTIGNSLKGNVEKVLGLGLDIKDMVGISEKCQEYVQDNTEIAYCIITDMDGTPLFLSDPQFKSLRLNLIHNYFISKDGRQVNVIGQNAHYFDTVTHINTPDGKPVAQVHVGFKQSVVSDRVSAGILRSLFVFLIFFLLSFSLVVLFVKRSIMQPISNLLSGVKKISDGDLSTRVNEIPIYEFNELAKNVNSMAESLKNREEEIQKGYLELENTHNKLHTSYLKLESLSLELERSEELYKSLMEDSGDAIVVVGGDETLKIVNKMAEEFFGYSAQELVGLPLTKFLLLIGIDDVPRVHRHFKDSLSGRPTDVEVNLVRKEGYQVVGRIHVSSVKSGGEQLVQATFRDVTRERETMQNLEKSAADLAKLNKMKDSFLGLASHELKTPLTVIMGYSELIMTDMVNKADKTVIEMVENIANAAARLDNIIKDMVDVSLIDERRLQLKLEDVNVNRLVEASLNEMRFFFSMRKQELVINFDESIPTIKGDGLRLMQLLSNVLGNAIKFTPDEGKVVISTSAKFLLRSKQPSSSDGQAPVVNIGKERHLYVEIIIEDTGIGIDRDDQLRIFDKFYEVGNIEEHSTGKVAFKSKGAGLGLAIAKGIVEMHGGEIWVESSGCNPETFPGSTFHILLPLNPVVGDATLDYLNLLR